ncbi:PAS domain S-box protein [Haloglomus litoreum]|uniref:PAS domain S-box protein n=1 Tax=Haloglomus litoreum TaxID=3034026 RepID=UPI0023E7FDCB|nr:PAS domain S-box protein [Haloglomus sp. DT116]
MTEYEPTDRHRELDIEAARTALYDVLVETDGPLRERQREALAVGCRYLGVENGHLKRMDDPDGKHRVVASTDPDSDWIPEDIALDDAGYCRTAVDQPAALAVQDPRVEGYEDNPGYVDHGVACYLGTDIVVEGETWGTVCFVSPQPTEETFTPTEATFVELVAQTIGREIAEDRYTDTIERTRSKYETLVETAPDGVLLVDASTGEIHEVNNRVSEMTGYSESELLGMSYLDLVPPEQRHHYDANDDLLTGADGPRERLPDGSPIYALDRDGTRRPVAISADTVHLDGQEYLHLVVRNISERRERERRAGAILDQTHQFTGLLEPDGTLLEANRAALEFAGVDRDEVVGEPFAAAPWWSAEGADRDRLRDAIDRAADGEFVRYETEVEGTNGTIVIDFSLRPVRDESGEVDLLIPEGRDISERVRRERQLAVLSRLLRHNFRNEMTVVRGYADMLTEDLTGQEREIAADLSENVDRLLELTETYRETVDLLSDPPEPTDVDLRRALQRAVDSVRAGHPDATVGIDCPGGVTVHALPRLGRAVEELVGNAIVHGGEGTQVTVAVDAGPESVVVRIVDDGPGIPAAEADILRGDQSVDPLAHGTGMGLWLVYWLVTLSGGNIVVGTPDSGGTEIELLLDPFSD